MRPHRALTACATLLAASPLCHADLADLLVIHDTGRLIVRSELTVNAGDVLIENGGVMEVHSGSVTTADTLEIQLGGLLTGCGTINANIINLGTIQSECGPATYLVVNGDLENGGTTKITNGTELQVSGTLTNNQLLDIRGGSMTTGTFINNGIFLSDGSIDVDIVSADVVGSDFQVTAATMSSRSYVMEFSLTLLPGSWIQVGFSQVGIDGPLLFTHPNGATFGKAFYRIRALPPGP